jgi:CPA1 family monovalent cation:H+ antiporter
LGGERRECQAEIAPLSVFDVGSIILVFAALLGVANDRFFGLPRVIVYLLGSLALSLCLILSDRVFGGLDLAELSERRVESAHLPRILLDGMLALLLFAASLQVDLRELRSQALAVLGLATVGVLLATASFTYAIWAVFLACGMDVPIGWCFVLGAILAPTDAVAVDGLIKRVPLPPALKAMISGESLFNDGTAVVVFLAALGVVGGEEHVIGHGRLLLALVIEGGGGGALGLLTGFVASLGLRQIKDDAVAVTVSLALALGTYRLAVALGLSGPIAVVVCGLVMAARPISADVEQGRRERLGVFWSLVDELLNTLLFLLMGFQILAIPLADFVFIPVLAAIPLALLSRFVSVALPMLFRREHAGEKVRAIALMTWVGLRGAVSVALALNLPDSPYRDVLSAACYAVVIFTIVVQGLLTTRVTNRLYPNPGGA